MPPLPPHDPVPPQAPPQAAAAEQEEEPADAQQLVQALSVMAGRRQSKQHQRQDIGGGPEPAPADDVEPAGDQPQAIDKLSEGLRDGLS